MKQNQLLQTKIESKKNILADLKAEIKKIIVGQDYLIERLLVAIFSNGHVLLEGVPGLAKTLAIKTLANCFDLSFKRIQFTPDLLPSDLIGTLIYNPKNMEFTPYLGPIFANIILADEINRSPAKVQSALLEAMQEHQVTIGEKHYHLPNPFLVLATENPIEHQGTYPLPEAEIDRFMMKLKITYPTREEEKIIIEKATFNEMQQINPVINLTDLLEIQDIIKHIYIDERIKEYILDLIFATRKPQDYQLISLKPLIEFGASPRATIYLTRAVKTLAFLNQRNYVLPEDVKVITKDILRHRIIPSFEADADDIDSEIIIDQILARIQVP
ncbi:MAG: MoxR family ATPase [Candidatus Margulisiibacteriota bacterium]|jgi:MoxR-like ATPase